jgi:hypothetical protein
MGQIRQLSKINHVPQGLGGLVMPPFFLLMREEMNLAVVFKVMRVIMVNRG